MTATFGQRLKSARIMARLSMDSLVDSMGRRVSKQAISKYENDLMQPDSGILIALSEALGVASDYFYSQNEIDIQDLNFRKKASLGKKLVDSLKARVKDAMERYIELDSFLPLSSPFSDPFAGLSIAATQDIEAAADTLRSSWGAGSETAIPRVIDLLEEHAVKVIELDAGEGFDGLSGWVRESPFIVLNSNSPTDRKRLTALHELAHLCLLFVPGMADAEKEKFCHSFGSAVLLPRKILARELGEKRSEISWFELRTLKEQYGISMQAIMYRARQQGIISDYVHERFSKEISARGWRKIEPGRYPVSERPQHFEQLLHRAISEELISLSKAAYLARKTIEVLRQERLPDDAPAHS